jgi:hypothetical protein
MPATVEVRNDKGLILSCSGVLTGNELIDVKRSLVTEQNKHLRYIITDLTHVHEFQIHADAIRSMVEQNKRLAAIAEPGMLVAIAAPQQLGFGLARMWEAYAHHETGWRTSVFHSRADADLWIEQNLKLTK